MKPVPIFIVGVPRSGTTLLSAMLAAHSRLSCGPETHFFRRLSEVDVDQLCDIETWPEPAIDFICSIKHSGFAGYDSKLLTEKYQLEASQIATYLENKAPSIPNILASVTEQYMTRLGKQRWIAKTPDHLEYVQLIRKYFPASPIVRIVRDPRNVALSLMKVPWGAKSFLEALFYWKRLDEISDRFFSTDRNSYTLRFEDLIDAPGEELPKLCRFLGEEFEEGMLDTSVTGARVNSRNVPWKDKASKPLDASRIAVWRTVLSQPENQLAEAILGDRLEAYGYPVEEKFVRVGEIYPTYQLAVKYADVLEALTSTGVRFWKTHENEKSTVKIYLGDPGYNEWLNEKTTEKIIDTLSISADILKATISDNSVYWIPEKEDGKWSGYCAYLLKKLLNPYKVTPEI